MKIFLIDASFIFSIAKRIFSAFSIAAEEELKSIKKSARKSIQEKSQKSFARSVRSKRLGPQ